MYQMSHKLACVPYGANRTAANPDIEEPALMIRTTWNGVVLRIYYLIMDNILDTFQ